MYLWIQYLKINNFTHKNKVMSKIKSISKAENCELARALVSSENAANLTEAARMIDEMKTRVIDGEDPEEILLEYGLEPDYIMDILF